MHFIIGGRHMGKLRYAFSLYGDDIAVCDLAVLDLKEKSADSAISNALVIDNLQAGVRNLLSNRICAEDFWESRLSRWRDKVLIGEEVGAGIVPMDPFEREWRDRTGFLYQKVAERADIVDRIWAGLPTRLKG